MGAERQVSKTLVLYLLGRCNLECLHCHMEGSPRREERLPLDAVLRAVGECPGLGIEGLTLTGGEPLLYGELDRVLEAAAGVSGLSVTVCTNGTLLTPRLAARFHELGVRVNVSIDGPPEFHDRFRNFAGAFRSSERGVRAAVDAGVPVTIISTISQANFDSLDFLFEWARAAGAGHFMLQPLLNLGRGTGIADQCLSFFQMNRLILHFTDLANRQPEPKMGCQVIGARREFLIQHPCGAFVCDGEGCHRGVRKEIKKLVVREDGTVLPEVPNLSHRYALGRIQDGPLPGLIQRYFESGYNEFDRLCRTAHAEVLPGWDCVIVPWEQIIAERSATWQPGDVGAAPDYVCAACSTTVYGATKPPQLTVLAQEQSAAVR